jgi:hypothetical protein
MESSDRIHKPAARKLSLASLANTTRLASGDTVI